MQSLSVYNEQGMTVLEMILGVSISLVLSTIALPFYQEYKARAYDAQAIALQHDLITATEAVATEMTDEYVGGHVYMFGVPGDGNILGIPFSGFISHGFVGSDFGGVKIRDYINGLGSVDSGIFFWAWLTAENSGNISREVITMHCKGTKLYQYTEDKNGLRHPAGMHHSTHPKGSAFYNNHYGARCPTS